MLPLPPERFTPGSPEWWLDRLGRRLDQRRRPMKRYEDYYEGLHPLLFASERFQQAFGDLFRPLSDNFMALVVDAVVERLAVVGFRFGDERGSDVANRIWQANELDADASLLFREALIKSEASVIVWRGPDGMPLVTPENPTQVVVDRDPAIPRLRQAALKRWDDERRTLATLYLPDRIYKFEAPRHVETVGGAVQAPTTWDDLDRGAPSESIDLGGFSWQRREVPGEPWPLPNPLGVVPVVPLVTRPRIDRTGRSELQVAIPLQDALNKIVADALVGSEYAAYRQRWATGIDIPIDPATGEAVEAFISAVERLWHTKAADAKFGDFAETDLGNYAKLIDLFVQHLASATRTPPHYLINTGVMPSGESQTAAESGLVSKVRDRQDDYADRLEDVMRLAFRILGEDELARQATGEVIWRDPERRTPSEFADSLIKLKSLGIHEEILQERAGFSPPEIARNRVLMAQRALEASVQQSEILSMLLDRGVDPRAASRIAGVELETAEVIPPAPTTNGRGG